MARIRSIKPEFFTSEDICALSPLARLLYIGTWLEADREGRLEWNPKTLKKRYFPDQQLDIEALCEELTTQGVVVLYGDGLACVPTFLEHQVINPREAKSKLPAPTEEELARVQSRVPTRDARSFPSLPSVPFHSGSLITSPAEYAKKLEFCAFVGSRLEVPKGLHADLMKLLGGPNADSKLRAWYLDLNTEIDESREPITPDVFRWLKARYAKWKAATGDPGPDLMKQRERELAEEFAQKSKGVKH